MLYIKDAGNRRIYMKSVKRKFGLSDLGVMVSLGLFYITPSNALLKKEENILKTHQKKIHNLIRNTMSPFQLYDIVTNLSKYQLNEDEMDSLKNGSDFSIPPKFLKKSKAFCQHHMTAKFQKVELEDNQISARLKNKLSQMANPYVCKYTLQ